jgi:hypothetical protein
MRRRMKVILAVIGFAIVWPFGVTVTVHSIDFTNKKPLTSAILELGSN